VVGFAAIPDRVSLEPGPRIVGFERLFKASDIVPCSVSLQLQRTLCDGVDQSVVGRLNIAVFVNEASRHSNVVWCRVVERGVSGECVEITCALTGWDTVPALEKMDEFVGDGVVGNVTRVDPDFMPAGHCHPAGGPCQANADARLPKLGEKPADIVEFLEDGLVSPVPLQRAGQLEETRGRVVVEGKRELRGLGLAHTV